MPDDHRRENATQLLKAQGFKHTDHDDRWVSVSGRVEATILSDYATRDFEGEPIPEHKQICKIRYQSVPKSTKP